MKKLPFYDENMKNPLTRRKKHKRIDLSGHDLHDIERVVSQELYKLMGPYGNPKSKVLSKDIQQLIEGEKQKQEARKYLRDIEKRRKYIKNATKKAARNQVYYEEKQLKKLAKEEQKRLRLLRPIQRKKFEDEVLNYLSQLKNPNITKKKKIIIKNKLDNLEDYLKKYNVTFGPINIDQQLNSENYYNQVKHDILNKEKSQLLNEIESPWKIPFDDHVENFIIQTNPINVSPKEKLDEQDVIEEIYLGPKESQEIAEIMRAPIQPVEYYYSPAEAVDILRENAVHSLEQEELDRLYNDTIKKLDDVILQAEEVTSKKIMEDQLMQNYLIDKNYLPPVPSRETSYPVEYYTEGTAPPYPYREPEEPEEYLPPVPSRETSYPVEYYTEGTAPPYPYREPESQVIPSSEIISGKTSSSRVYQDPISQYVTGRRYAFEPEEEEEEGEIDWGFGRRRNIRRRRGRGGKRRILKIRRIRKLK